MYAFADEAGNTLDTQIDAMKRNHLDGLEIRCVDGENVSDISFAKAAEIRSKMDGAGLKVWSIGSPIGKISIDDPFQPHLEKLKHTLEVSSILGADRIRIFSFYLPANQPHDRYRNAVMDRVGAMLELAKGSDISLCHENEKGIYGDLAIHCKELLDTFPSLQGIFDPANFVQVGQDVWAAWEMLRERMDYLHIKDALRDGRVVPAGHGVGYVKDVLSDYAKRGGRKLTIEPHLAVFDGLSSLERDGEKSVVGTYVYESNEKAFDVACEAVKMLLGGISK